MSLELKQFYISNHRLFATLPQSQLLALSQVSKLKTFYRGESIEYGMGSGSKLCLLLKGKVKLMESNDKQDDLVKDILYEGDVFGDLGLDGQPPVDEYAEALTDNTIICSIYVDDFKAVLAQYPLLAINFTHQVGSKLRKAESRHADLVFRDARFRLIRFIKDWANSDGNRVGNKIVLNNYLTHSDIAGFISTSRQSVNVLLNELKDTGALYYNRKKVELNDSMIWN
jgi:CRP/FNR family transcriptional regulator, cyclic AMP receptor protein